MQAVSTRTGWAAASALACVCVLSFATISRAESGKGSLAARLQAVEDRQAIEQLMMGDYPLALDRRLWKEYANTFTEDGELVQGTNVTKGRAAIEELFSRPRPPSTPAADAPATPRAPPPPPGEFGATKHVVTNLALKLNGDTATATAYWQTIATRSNGTVVAAAGHYVDSLKKVKGQWKFTRREIVNPSRPNAIGAAPPEAAPAQPAR
jgi:hypothetical protein